MTDINNTGGSRPISIFDSLVIVKPCQVDADSYRTQRAVVSSPNFVDVLMNLIAYVDLATSHNIHDGFRNATHIVGLFCKTWYHRADTCGRHLCACLNNITFKGMWAFNALHQGLHKQDTAEVIASIWVASSWADEAWCLIPSGSVFESLATLAATRPESWRNTQSLWEAWLFQFF